MSVEATYVGNRGRNLIQWRNINQIPYGARFLPQNADPTNPSVALPDNFFRPFPGYGNIQMYEWTGKSRYHGLEVAVNRRLQNNIAFGVAYTLSQAKDYSSGNYWQTQLPTYHDDDDWAWGFSNFDQTHVLTTNFTWQVPGLGADAGGLRHLLDDWSLSGLLTFASGTPLGISSFSTTNNVDLVGGGDGQPPVLVGDLQLPRSERTFDRWFAAENVRRPERGEIGNSRKGSFRGPGYNNVDLTLSKALLLGAADRRVEFRWEVYNVFNTFQYSNVNTSPRFDAQGNQVNALFGRITAARDPRIMQLSLRLAF